MEGRRRRLTFSDQMSAVDNCRSLAGYTLDDVLANNKRQAPRTPSPASAREADIRNRTLLDIIRDEEIRAGKHHFGHKDKRTWKSFRDKLRLKRAGSAWVSSVPIPTSDIPFHNKRSLIGNKRNQVRFNTVAPKHSKDSTQNTNRCSTQMEEPSSPSQRDHSSENLPALDSAPIRVIRPQMSRHNSVRVSNEAEDYTDPTEPERDHRSHQISTTLSAERTLSAREAVAEQEAADAAAAAAAAAEEEKEEEEENNEDENEGSTTGSETSAASQPVRMSLMDLLHETDKEMGLEASNYAMGDDEYDDDEYYEDEDEDEEDEDEEEEEEGGEFRCCVCNARHRSGGLVTCGHTFCRLCSKELMVSRGNCPTCNDYILEILHAF